LLNNKDEYESVSEKARSTTAEWLSGMNGSALEKWLEGLEKKQSHIPRELNVVEE
jgi:hypothetical protein